MTTQHFVDKTLEERADEREAAARSRTMTKVAGALVNLGLGVSALLTIAYLTLLTQEAAGLLDPWGYVLGGLVGIVAIIPAELGLIIWRERLAGERQITGFQRGTAVVAMLLAGVFSALTTSSFFSYTLPQLFPPSYLAIAPTLNVGAIVGAWIVFILAVVFYAVSSRETQQNLASAAAFQSMFDARVAVLRSSAEAVRTGAQNTVVAMEQMGVFERDARRLIVGSLGYDADALATLPHLAKTTIDQPPADDPSTDGPPTDGPPADGPPADARPTFPSDYEINLVDLAEQVTFNPVNTVTPGSPKILTHDGKEWLETWVGGDGITYAQPTKLSSDAATAWHDAKQRGIVPDGMSWDRFKKLHTTGNFTNGRSSGRQGA